MVKTAAELDSDTGKEFGLGTEPTRDHQRSSSNKQTEFGRSGTPHHHANVMHSTNPIPGTASAASPGLDEVYLSGLAKESGPQAPVEGRKAAEHSGHERVEAASSRCHFVFTSLQVLTAYRCELNSSCTAGGMDGHIMRDLDFWHTVERVAVGKHSREGIQNQHSCWGVFTGYQR